MDLTQEQADQLLTPTCAGCGKARRKACAVPYPAVQWRCDHCLRPFCDAFQPPAIPEAAVTDYHRYRTEPNLYFPGDCFMRAYRYVQDHPNDPAIRVHHGLYQEAYFAMTGMDAGHGWVAIGLDVCFDPNWQRFFRTEDYYEHLAIVPQASYTAFEAKRLHRKSARFGPWDRERRNTNHLYAHLLAMSDAQLQRGSSAS